MKKVSGFVLMMTMAVAAMANNVQYTDTPITGTFGIRLGEILDSKLSSGTFKDDLGRVYFRISPKPLPGMAAYLQLRPPVCEVRVNKDNKIFFIRSVYEPSSRNNINLLIDLQEKYGALDFSKREVAIVDKTNAAGKPAADKTTAAGKPAADKTNTVMSQELVLVDKNNTSRSLKIIQGQNITLIYYDAKTYNETEISYL